MVYVVEVIITNKRSVRDPEGETIHKDLVVKRGFSNVVSIRSGRYLEFYVNNSSCAEAVEYVRDLCYRLRIYNPVVHEVTVRPSGRGGCDQVPGD